MTGLELTLTLLVAVMGATMVWYYLKAAEYFIDNKILCCKIVAQGDTLNLAMRHVGEEKEQYLTSYYRGRYHTTQRENFGEVIDDIGV